MPTKMMKGLIFFLILSAFFAGPSGLRAADDLARAEEYFDRGGPENYRQALELYLAVLEKSPEDYEINWKVARAYREYAREIKEEGLEGWKEICARDGKEGMAYARKAIELQPEEPEGHYYYGLSVGIYSDGVSILRALKEGLKNKTQQSLEQAYKLDKMYGKAGPILAMGRFWAVLPWPLRDREKALQFYREYEATEYFAASDEGRIYLAELLLDLGGKKNREEAHTLLEKALQSEKKYFRDWAGRLLSRLE